MGWPQVARINHDENAMCVSAVAADTQPKQTWSEKDECYE